MASELGADIWAWLGYPDPYDKSQFTIVYQAAMQSGKPLSDLRRFLEESLLCRELHPWYSIVPRVFWYRIYGTNVDDVIERAYRSDRNAPALEVVSAPADDFRERDQFLSRLQYIKLHGSLPGDPRSLTFSTTQFAQRANAQEDWWRHFVRDYVFHPTVFIGTEVDEPLFWQAIVAREGRGQNPEERPQSYLISPSISPAKKAVLQGYNITHIAATGGEFFQWLESEFRFPDRLAVLSSIAPESAEILGREGTTAAAGRTLTSFLTAFPRVPTPVPNPARPRLFFSGAPPTWEDIASDFDAPREINRTLLAAVEECLLDPDLSVVSLIAEGGAGKSTVLRRTALTMRQNGREVFFSDGAERFDPQVVVDALSSFPERVCLFIDNAALLGRVLADLLEALRSVSRPPVLVIGARYIAFEQRLRGALRDLRHSEIEVPYLSDPDITAILSKLEQFQKLGKLRDLNADERRYEFKQRARKQILVAMREATEGMGFNEIMQSEYSELADHEHRILFLCAALATASLVDLTEKQWFDCASASPSDTLRMLRRDLRGLIHISGPERLISARHPVIAEYILDHVAGAGDVMEAYRRVLVAISRDIFGGAGRKHRSWRLFVRLINHQSVFERLGKDIGRARGVYELTADTFGNDGHFWLQYANLEIDHGNPSFARAHLANAEGLLGNTDLVINTRAHMLLREALTVGSFQEALSMRREAEEVLFRQMERASSDDEYPFHMYLTHVLGWLRAWAPNREAMRKELESLLHTANEAHARMPRNRKLKSLLDTLQREYLMLAVGK